jgi:hypothetical protein
MTTGIVTKIQFLRNTVLPQLLAANGRNLTIMVIDTGYDSERVDCELLRRVLRWQI